MNAIEHYLAVVMKRLRKKKWAPVIIIVIYLFCFGVSQYMSSQYKTVLIEKENFREYEAMKMATYHSYRVLASEGFRLLLVPHVAGIFFNDSALMGDTLAEVDTSERLRIINILKGKNLFALKKPQITSLSGLIYYLGSLLALLYGFKIFLQGNHLKYFSSLASPGKVYIRQFIARAAKLLLHFLVLTGISMATIWANGLQIPFSAILAYLIPGFSILILFLSMGMMIGAMKSPFAGLTVATVGWLMFTVFLPGFIDFHVISESKEITPIFSHEVSKQKFLANFEKQFRDETGIFKLGTSPKEKQKILVRSYYKIEYKSIQELEESMRDQMSRHSNHYFSLSMFLPTSHYIAVTGELSSRGFLSQDDLYRHTQGVKHDFSMFFKDKVYENPPPKPKLKKDEKAKPQKLESFIKGDENLFYARPRVPWTYWWGLLIGLFYTLLFLLRGYLLFKKNLFALPPNSFKHRERANDPLEIQEGEINAFEIYQGSVPGLFLRDLLSPPKGGDTSFHLTLNGAPTGLRVGRGSLMYVGKDIKAPGHLKAGDFLKQIAGHLGLSASQVSGIEFLYFKETDFEVSIEKLSIEKYRELLCVPLLFSTHRTYVVGDITRGMPDEFHFQLVRRLENLKESGATVLLMHSVDTYWDDDDPGEESVIIESRNWLALLKGKQKQQRGRGDVK